MCRLMKSYHFANEKLLLFLFLSNFLHDFIVVYNSVTLSFYITFRVKICVSAFVMRDTYLKDNFHRFGAETYFFFLWCHLD
jgi:hypothetical protein